MPSLARYGQSVFVRLSIVLIVTLLTLIGLPLLAVAWFEAGMSTPIGDSLAEAAVQFHGILSSGAFYATSLYAISDAMCEIRSGRSISSRLQHSRFCRGTSNLVIRLAQLLCLESTDARQLKTVETYISQLETVIEYQHTSIVFLTDAFDEVQITMELNEAQLERQRCRTGAQELEARQQRELAASLADAVAASQAVKKQDELQLNELTKQLIAQKDGIKMMEEELVRLRLEVVQKADTINALQADLAHKSIPTAHKQAYVLDVGSGDVDKTVVNSNNTIPKKAPAWISPLNTWVSRPRMLLTARVRPGGNTDLHDAPVVSIVSGNDDGPPCAILRDPKDGTETRHHFDHCFGPSDTNETVWEEFKDLLLGGFFKGFTVAIATDGPSGSGKTFSMFKGQNALISTAVHNILEDSRDPNLAIKVRAVEVYKNKSFDVVHKMHHKVGRDTSRSRSPGHRLSGPWEHHAAIEFRKPSSLDEIKAKILAINGCRTNKDTVMNTSKSSLKGGSSRGHLILTLSRADDDGDKADSGRLVFIDLAGTEERGANDLKADAEYDDIRKDRSDCYFYFKNFGKATPINADRMLIQVLRLVLAQPLRITRIVQLFHLSKTDHERNLLLMRQKKELENVDPGDRDSKTRCERAEERYGTRWNVE